MKKEIKLNDTINIIKECGYIPTVDVSKNTAIFFEHTHETICGIQIVNNHFCFGCFGDDNDYGLGLNYSSPIINKKVLTDYINTLPPATFIELFTNSQYRETGFSSLKDKRLIDAYKILKNNKLTVKVLKNSTNDCFLAFIFHSRIYAATIVTDDEFPECIMIGQFIYQNSNIRIALNNDCKQFTQEVLDNFISKIKIPKKSQVICKSIYN